MPAAKSSQTHAAREAAAPLTIDVRSARSLGEKRFARSPDARLWRSLRSSDPRRRQIQLRKLARECEGAARRSRLAELRFVQSATMVPRYSRIRVTTSAEF